MTIKVQDKETLEEMLRIDYTSSGIDYRIAALYAMNAVALIQKADVGELMQFIMGLRADALDGSIHEVEKKSLTRMDSELLITYVDLEKQINQSKTAEDLFNYTDYNEDN